MLTDIHGTSGRAMIEALIAGERRPKVLAELAKGRARARLGALAEAADGRFTDHHARLSVGGDLAASTDGAAVGPAHGRGQDRQGRLHQRRQGGGGRQQLQRRWL